MTFDGKLLKATSTKIDIFPHTYWKDGKLNVRLLVPSKTLPDYATIIIFFMMHVWFCSVCNLGQILVLSLKYHLELFEKKTSVGPYKLQWLYFMFVKNLRRLFAHISLISLDAIIFLFLFLNSLPSPSHDSIICLANVPVVPSSCFPSWI